MRPQAPDVIIPPAPVDEAERTPSENPLAKMIEGAVSRAMAGTERRIIDAITKVGNRMTVLELSQKANEAAVHAERERINDHETRLRELEQWRRDTERCPPPSEGP